MPWSHPAARMREFIAAMRAIWAHWYRGEPLNFRGEFYRHTLMTPAFSPKPSDAGPPRIFLAAVGPLIPELNKMSKEGRWAEMGDLISEEMLHTFAVVAEPEQIVPKLRERFGGLIDRVTLDFSFAPAQARAGLIRQLAA